MTSSVMSRDLERSRSWLVIPISLRPFISKTAQDRDLVTTGQWASLGNGMNGHVAYDVIGPRKV